MRAATAKRERDIQALPELDALLGRPLFAITQADLDALLPRDEQAPLRQRIREHVRDWFSTRADRLDGQTPDDAQLDVVSCIEGDLLVRARAGSGKTRKEIANRLERMGCAAPHIMSFHALSVAIYRPDTEILTDDEDDQGRSRLKGALARIVRELECDETFASPRARV